MPSPSPAQSAPSLSRTALARAAARVRRAAASLLPMRCVLCQGPGASPWFCAGCASDLPGANSRRCARCAIAVASAGALCGRCIAHGPAFDATVAAMDYAPPVDRLVVGLKFGGRLPLAEALAAPLADAARKSGLSVDVLVPVPLSGARLAERGFNQAARIAAALSPNLAARCDAAALVKVRDTPHQADLPLDARRANVRRAFACLADVRGLSVGVVDDVMTSGSTLNEIARVLKLAGAARVANLVACRTPAG